MPQRILAILLFMMILSAYPTYSVQANAIPLVNPSFEINQDPYPEVPDGWAAGGLINDRVRCNNRNSFSQDGRCGFQFSGDGARSFLQQRVNVQGQAGSTFTLSLWLNSRNVPADAALIRLRFFQNGIAVYSEDRAITQLNTNAFVPFTMTATTPTAFSRVRVRIEYRGTSGRLLIDHVRLTEEASRISFMRDDSNFPNPERGFYDQDAPLWLGTQRTDQTVAALSALRNEGISLVRWYFLIDEFRDRPIDQDTLDYIDSQFENARAAGVKVIPRFAYNFPMGGEFPYTDPDAPLSQVLAHIEQLRPLLTAHADVIAFMEAGFVGAWGEWHSSTHVLVDPNTGLNDSSIAIIDALLNALPTNRMIAMRYLPHKRQLYPNALTIAEAFSGSDQARIGAHNDCFSASETDWGTYPIDQIDLLKAYYHQDNQYLPQGGETCNDGPDAQPYIGCSIVVPQMAYLRYSALNRDYHQGVLARWETEGCYETIARRMGYRFRLINAEVPSLSTGEARIRLTIVNEGFANAYNPRAAYLVLREVNTGAEVRMVVANDVRWWQVGETTLEGTFSNLANGTYQVLLALPDPMLPNRPEYAIRMANLGIWEASTGLNNLGATITVTR
ncbi:MAG: DUF4832 domain-containing protein [Anaerolineae bacterium]|jgi:hypothetical protein|nr:DUF4832 domain-containing protein [Anaerolineae bacterium]